MNPARRRISREMAVQMLYQSDLGGSPLPQIFRSFDLTEYLTREEPGSEKRVLTREEERAESMRRRRQAEEAFVFAQGLVTGTIDRN